LSDIKPWRAAGIYRNRDFIFIETQSGYSAVIRDPEGAAHYLAPGSDDEALGRCLIDALSKSCFITPDKRSTRPGFFDFRMVAEGYKRWIAEVLDRYGYKTKQALFKKMILCHAKVVDGVLTLGPTRHDKLEAWEGLSDDEKVTLPFDSSEAEIGAALRVALDRCIP